MAHRGSQCSIGLAEGPPNASEDDVDEKVAVAGQARGRTGVLLTKVPYRSLAALAIEARAEDTGKRVLYRHPPIGEVVTEQG